MSDYLTLDPGATTILVALQPLFAPYSKVAPVRLSNPGIVEEFRPGNVKNTDLAHVPKPALDWAFSVECGVIKDDARLCALVFTQFSRLQAFYAANPGLHGTLVSGWHGVGVIWLRATGRIPNNFAVDEVRWCSEGTILIGCPTQSPDIFVSQRGEIKEINFTGIVWNERQREAVEKILIAIEVGGPLRTGTRGRRVLNVAFWARYFTNLMLITYDPDRDLFAWGDPKVRQPTLLTVDETAREFTNLLQTVAPSFGAEFPHGEIRPARVRQLVERIKLLTQLARASDAEVLDAFMREYLICTSGNNVASHEFRARYVDYCQGLGRSASSAPRFYRMLRAKLASLEIVQRHDILRDGKRVRGYSGLALKLTAPPQSPDATNTAKNTDATDASDAPDGA